ncbi:MULTISPECIES: LbetaH domain-containing protein [Microbacterium]|uniref:hypothetical protein n=1 Tax=Microbacterium TaxID=33882 RepID=UPI0010F90626|nr:hypothetical protein [Microbacterium sp. 4NA327F11]
MRLGASALRWNDRAAITDVAKHRFHPRRGARHRVPSYARAVGLALHEATVLGDNVKQYQGVTLGRAEMSRLAAATRSGDHIVVEDGVMI